MSGLHGDIKRKAHGLTMDETSSSQDTEKKVKAVEEITVLDGSFAASATSTGSTSTLSSSTPNKSDSVSTVPILCKFTSLLQVYLKIYVLNKWICSLCGQIMTQIICLIWFLIRMIKTLS